jgi:hypothetical protein
MKRWLPFTPAIVLFALAWWPFLWSPMTKSSTFWAFYLAAPLTVAAFIALAVSVAMFLLRKAS